jgi:hypothetical protein
MMSLVLILASMMLIAFLSCHRNQKKDGPIGPALQASMAESIKDSDAIGVSAGVVFSHGKMWAGATGISHEGVEPCARGGAERGGRSTREDKKREETASIAVVAIRVARFGSCAVRGVTRRIQGTGRFRRENYLRAQLTHSRLLYSLQLP